MIDPCNQLDIYLLGDLNLSETALFEKHLKECDECRDGLARTREIEQELRADFSNTKYRDLWAISLLDRVRRLKPARPSKYTTRSWRSVAAIAAMGLFVALWVWSQRKPNVVHEFSLDGQTSANTSSVPESDSPALGGVDSRQSHSVHAAAGYLSAKLPSGDKDFEIYQVLPEVDYK